MFSSSLVPSFPVGNCMESDFLRWRGRRREGNNENIYTPCTFNKILFLHFFSIPVCSGVMLSIGVQSGKLLLSGGWVIEAPQDERLLQSDTSTWDSILAVQLHAWVLGKEVTKADESLHFSESYFLLFLGSWESASHKAVCLHASQSVRTFSFAYRTFTVSRSPAPMHLRESWLLPHPEGESCRQPGSYTQSILLVILTNEAR